MSVTHLPVREKQPIDCEHEDYLRRQAIQLAAQLPGKPQDALEVIEHMTTLVRTFLCSRPA